MMQYEYPNNIDACFATEFDECVGFHKECPVTSASVAMAAEGERSARKGSGSFLTQARLTEQPHLHVSSLAGIGCHETIKAL